MRPPNSSSPLPVPPRPGYGQQPPQSPPRWTPTRIGLIALVVVVILASVLGMFWFLSRDEVVADEERGACALLIDVTGQPGPEWSETTLEDGRENFQDICEDRQVYASLITDNSKASPCLEVDRDTYPGDLDNENTADEIRDVVWAEEGATDEIRDEQITSLWTDVAALRNCGLYGAGNDPASAPLQEFEGSDVFSAIDVSQELMDPIDGPKDLFILSDMINSMPPMKTPPKESVESAVQQLQSDGVIPDLSGVEVVVVGLATNSNMSPGKQARLKEFWTQYFETAGADVSFRQVIG